MFKGEERNT